ncbi:MAG: class I SAM-dependent methyltransferase [Candidatus Omnitrophica bacterium]|nr:class I SAM-dependent methyltransferase [Candidatus Omnitrophota bacterium]
MSDFDKFSSDYENILDKKIKYFGESTEYFAEYKAEYVRKYLGDDFKGRILDYGCGIGLIVKYLKQYFDKNNVEIMGYDVSLESTKRANQEMPDIVFTHDFNKIKKNNFDVIVLANVLHHVKPEERSVFIRKAKSFLVKGGRIFIFEHNPYNPLTRLIVKLCVFDKEVIILKRKETVKLLIEAGMNISEKRYIVFFPQILKMFRFLEPILGCVPMGTQYLCIGKV